MKSLRRYLSISLLIILCAAAAWAEKDPPGRVARLDYMTGSVSIQPRGVDDWVAAAMNRPLTTADRIWTDKESRAELQLGAGALRLNSETSLTLSNVSDNAVQLELDQGVLNVRVAALYPGEIYEIDTPNMAFTILKPGSYRFDVDADGDTSAVTVWKGEGEATGDGPAQRVRSGDRARFSSGRSLTHFFSGVPALDGFDDWCLVRDKRSDGIISARYVSRGVVGYEDLDDYGYWTNISPYGYVWAPYRVVTGWAPYRYGHWIWLEPWGWTWVDDAPWGFAPFHYGRWVYYRTGWYWAPGPVYARPIWAPALVGWYGGGGWGVSFGFGAGWGWFPLGWGEPFIPFYGHSRGYFRNVNVYNTHITNINYITNNYYGRHSVDGLNYAYRGRADAVTAAGVDTFTHSRPVQGDRWTIEQRQLKGAQIAAGNSLTPTRQSVLGGEGRVVQAPPSRAFDRRVVSRMDAPARPAPFRGPDASSPMAPGRTPDARASEGMHPGNAGVAAPNRGEPITPRGEPGTPRAPQSDAGVRGTEPGSEGRQPGPMMHSVHRPPATGNVAENERPEAGRPDVRSSPAAVDGRTSGPRNVPRPPRDTTPGPENRTAPETRTAPAPRPSAETRPAPENRPSPETRTAPPERQAPPSRTMDPRPQAPPSRTEGPSAPRPENPPAQRQAPPQREQRQPPQREAQPQRPQQQSYVPRPSQEWLSRQGSQPSRFATESQRAEVYSAPQWQSMRAAPQWHAAPSYSAPQARSYAPSMPSRAQSYGGYGGGRSAAPSYSGGGRSSAPSYSAHGGGGGGGGRSGRSR